MLATLRNAWKIPELRGRILFTLLMFLVFRLGVHIPVPGINSAVLEQLMGNNLFGFIDLISGGAFKNFTIFAMGITPYINASIIIQLLTVIIPSWEKLAKEGQEGRKKLAEYTRYATVILGGIQALGMSYYLRSAMEKPGFWSYAIIVITLSAGTAFLMWLGELITERGIGNGISLIIFAGIVSRLPISAYRMFLSVRGGQISVFVILAFVVMAIVVIAGVVAIHEAERKIPVQYAKRVVGRRIYGGQSTHIPLKINQSGVLPVIFAMSILVFPSTIASWFPNSSFARSVVEFFDFGSIWYMIIYALLIIFFSYFYTAITFNPVDIADNMKKHGGFIPGLRPGRSTADYIEKVLSRITLAGAIFLAFIALLPNILNAITGLNTQFGGTGLLIVVGVALETMKQIEAHLVMRHYQGFMK